MVALPADAALVRTPLPDHDESRGACAAESRPMSHPAVTADALADDCHQRRHRRRAAPCLSDSARLISALSSALFSASLSRASSTRSRPCCSPIAAACAATYSLTTWRTCEHGTRVNQVLRVNGAVATSISRVNLIKLTQCHPRGRVSPSPPRPLSLPSPSASRAHHRHRRISRQAARAPRRHTVGGAIPPERVSECG